MLNEANKPVREAAEEGGRGNKSDNSSADDVLAPCSAPRVRRMAKVEREARLNSPFDDDRISGDVYTRISIINENNGRICVFYSPRGSTLHFLTRCLHVYLWEHLT